MKLCEHTRVDGRSRSMAHDLRALGLEVRMVDATKYRHAGTHKPLELQELYPIGSWVIESAVPGGGRNITAIRGGLLLV